MKGRRLKKILYAVLWILPYFAGLAGYLMAGEPLMNACYAAFTLYAVNPVSDANNALIFFAKWGAPLVLASGVILALQGLVNRIREFCTGLHKDATAVYSDNENGTILAEQLKRGILVKDGRLRDVENHILLFERDADNLNFYQKNRELLQGKNIYLQLNEIDSFLLKESSVHFFNLFEMVARQYWKSYPLLGYFQKDNKSVKVAIVGFSKLGQQILNFALMYNIYDPAQQIEYHIWGESSLYEHMLENMELMNGDRIFYHKNDWKEEVQIFSSMDRIILTEENQPQLLQAVLYLTGKREVYCYCSGGAPVESIYKKENLISFGNNREILTEENVKSDTVYRAAKELNYRYAVLYGNAAGDPAKKEQEMEEQWQKLDGFTKGSNIVSADYHVIRKLIQAHAKAEGRELTMDELGQMEHLRWCRFHYLNHWKYGVPADGRNKDAALRIHKCLIPYEELTKEEQDKDLESIKVLMDCEQSGR